MSVGCHNPGTCPDPRSQTSDLSVCRMMPNPLSHASHGERLYSLMSEVPLSQILHSASQAGCSRARRSYKSAGSRPQGHVRWVSEVKGQYCPAGIHQLPGNRRCSPGIPGCPAEGEDVGEERRNTRRAQLSSEESEADRTGLCCVGRGDPASSGKTGRVDVHEPVLPQR